MSSIDNRVVRMVFDNSKFKAAAAATKTSLDNVTNAVTKAGKNRGLLDLGKSMDQIVGKSKTMQIAAVTAIGTISNKLTNMALNAGKALVLDPIKAGFQEYGELLTKQNVIQNATNNTTAKGQKIVKGVLNELNTYSDKTIYSFSNMTEALTTFVNAGVPLKKASKSIQGIANASALAGATSEESKSSFLGFSQSLSAGFVGLQDWKQASVTGKIGTVAFKNELLKAAAASGSLTKKGDEYVTKSGKRVSATKGFNESLKTQWATSEALNIALGKYTDPSTKLGKSAIDAAQKVRTFSAFMGTLKESLASGWAQVFGALFGGLEDATKMWTGLSLAIGGVIGKFFTFVTTALEVWRTMGGATKVAQGFKNILSPFAALFKAIGDAWHAAFPKSGKGAGSGLYGLSVAFELLTRPLTWLAKLIGLLVHPLTIFFKIIRAGGIAVGKIVDFIVAFAKAIWAVATFKTPSTGGFWDFILKVGGWARDAARGVQELIDKAQDLIEKFQGIDFKSFLPDMPKINLPGVGGFDLGSIFGGGDKKTEGGLAKVNTEVMSLVTNIKGLGGTTNIKQLSDNMDGLKASASGVNLKQLTGNMDGLSSVMSSGTTNIKQLTDNMDGYLTPSLDKVSSAGSGFWGVIKNITSAIGGFFGKIKGEDIVTSLNFAVLATMGITFAQFLRSFGGVLKTLEGIGKAAKGVLESTSGAIDEFASSRKRESQARLIMAIAIALGILALSLWLLSKIPKDKLMTALQALGAVMIGFSILMVVLTKAVNKMDGDKVVSKLYALGFAMVGIGLGVLLLSVAFKVLEKVGWDSIAKGLITIAVIFAGLYALGTLAEKSGRKFVAAAAAMVIIGGALIVLAFALMLFKLVDYESMTKAGLVLAALTVSLMLIAKLPAKALAKAGTTILAISVSMLILANALLMFALVQWESIAKAGVVLAGLTLALILMGSIGPSGALVIVAVGAALLMIAVACLALNKVEWSSIAKAGVILLGLILAFGALLLLVTIFAPAVALLTTLAIGMALLAGAAALLALAIAVIIPLLGVAAVGIVVFATAAAVAIAVFLQTLAAEMPNIKKSLDKILKMFVQFLVDAVPVIVQGIIDIIDALTEKVPDFVRAGIDFIVALIGGIGSMLAGVVEAAVNLVLKFVDGLIDNIDKFRDAAIQLIVKFIDGIADSAIDILNAGVQLIADFLHALATTIRTGSDKVGAGITDVIGAIKDLGAKMGKALVDGIVSTATAVPRKLWDLGKSLVNNVKGGFDEESESQSPSRLFMRLGKFLVDGLTIGVQKNASAAITAVANMVSGQIAIASQYMSKYIQDLDQKAIAATAKAEGLAKAAELASDAAGKTKSTADDKAADKLKERADKAGEYADSAEERADKAKAKADRKDEYKDKSNLEKAKMKSEDAAEALDEAKEMEKRAATNLTAAKALEAQARTKGGMSESERKKLQAQADAIRKTLKDKKQTAKEEAALEKKVKAIEDKIGDPQMTSAQRKKLRDQADDLRDQAEKEAKAANTARELAKTNAAAALVLQKKAGAEAAAEFQKQFDEQAAADAKVDAFEKLTDAQKAESRRKSAANLNEWSAKNLANAKKLAYTDLAAANELAQKAMEQADQARDYIKEAADLDKAVADKAAADAEEKKTSRTVNIPITGTTSVDLTASDAAALAFNQYSALYSAGSAAAAAAPTIEFKQYNTSPESLTPTEIYRQTNNLLTHASDKLGKAA